MRFFFAKSDRSISELLTISEGFDVVLMDSDSIKAEEELDLAYHLARKTFDNKLAIAKKFKYEFLLWLTGKTDIKSAMKKSEPKDAIDLLVVCFGKETKKELMEALGLSQVMEKKNILKKRSDPLRLEEISLSRVKN